MCFWVGFIRCQSSLSFETSYLSVFAGHDRALSGVPNLPNFLTFTLPQFISLVPQITCLKTRPSFQQPTKHAKANIPSTYPLSRSLATRSFISHGNTLRSHFVHVTLSAYSPGQTRNQSLGAARAPTIPLPRRGPPSAVCDANVRWN